MPTMTEKEHKAFVKEEVKVFKNNFWYIHKEIKDAPKGIIKTEGVPYKRKNLIDAWNMLCRRYTIYKHNAKEDKYYDFIVDWCEHHGLTVWTHSILFPYHKDAHILTDPQPWLGL